VSKWQGNDNADAHSISLSVEINVKRLLMEECVAQAVLSLRELADRIERGELVRCLPEETDDVDWQADATAKPP
jgi:hypothetical protein